MTERCRQHWERGRYRLRHCEPAPELLRLSKLAHRKKAAIFVVAKHHVDMPYVSVNIALDSDLRFVRSSTGVQLRLPHAYLSHIAMLAQRVFSKF